MACNDKEEIDMKTIMDNNRGLDMRYPSFNEDGNFIVNEFARERSCFYDFGARSAVEFSGFVDEEDSEFINEVGRYFQR